MVMRYFIILFICFTTLQLKAQISANIYEDENISEIVKAHHTIAILPMDVYINDFRKEKNRWNDAEIREFRKEHQTSFQERMYFWLDKIQEKSKVKRHIQQIDITNKLLRKNRIYSSEDLLSYPPDELAELLGVDAFFAGEITLAHTFNQSGAAVLAILANAYITTGEADVSIGLFCGEENQLIWSFNRVTQSNFINTPKRLADYLIKRFSKQLPYRP